MSSLNLSQAVARGGNGGQLAGGGAGLGGGIFVNNFANVSLANVTFSNTTAIGGNGGINYSGGGSAGGGGGTNGGNGGLGESGGALTGGGGGLAVACRAEELKIYIHQHFPKEKVHIIAHSMGGLDARYAISSLGLDQHTISLTTVGTPHRGTTAADLGVCNLEGYVKPWFQFLRIPHEAFYDLMTASCQAFNEKVVDAPDVNYYAIAGRNSGAWLSPEWWIPHGIVLFREGMNDGIVSVTSACHHYPHEIWDGDHMSLVNWPNPRAIAQGIWRARPEQYLKIAERLKQLELKQQ